MGSCGLPLMIYSTVGSLREGGDMDFIRANGLGCMISASNLSNLNHLKKLENGDIPWALDNGAYTAFIRGVPFNAETFLFAIEKGLLHGRRPDFGIVPDIMGEGDRSLAFSLDWYRKLGRDFPWYLALQPGVTDEKALEAYSQFDGVFLGGPGQWRILVMARWVERCHAIGTKVHVGRMGTAKKVAAAVAAGVDSIDSTNWVRNRGDFSSILEGGTIAAEADDAGRFL